MKKTFLIILGVLVALFKIDNVNAFVEDYNDNYTQAKSVTLNQTTYSDANDQSNGDTGYDIDYYKIYLPQDGYIWITLNQSYGGAQYHVDLKNSSNTTFYNMWTESVNQTSVKSPVIGLKAGTYYIEIDGFQPATVNDSQYNFLVSYGNSGFWEKEQNDYYNQANNISLNQVVNGTTSYGTCSTCSQYSGGTYYDNDYYKFTISKKMAINLSFTHAQTGKNTNGWSLYVFDQNWNRKYYSASLGNLNTNHKFTLDPGTYYLDVSGTHRENGYQYAFQLTETVNVSKVTIKKISTKSKKVTLKWKKVSGASGYKVYMATSKNGKYKKVATVANGNKLTYTKKGLKKKKKYYFKVRAYTNFNTGTVHGSYSSVKSIKVK